MKGFIVLLSLIPSVGFSFTLNTSSDSNLKGWPNSRMVIQLNLSNCPSSVDVRGVMTEAAEVWNNVPTSNIKISFGEDTTATSPTDSSIVYCETNFEETTGGDQDNVPGSAGVDGSSGTISRGLMYLNVSSGRGNIANFDRSTLVVIFAHEVGHLLGLGHSDDSFALMYYNGSAKKEPRLGQDDIDGISYLYPSDELKDSGQMAGCGSVITKSPPPPPPNQWIVNLGIVLLIMTPFLMLLTIRCQALFTDAKHRRRLQLS